MLLSIIIVNYNVYEDIKICVQSIRNFIAQIKYEIIIIDNNSPDRSIENIKHDIPGVIFIPLATNFGFGHANNIGMGIAKGKYFLFVNPDILFTDNSIEKLLNFLESTANAGAVGPIQIKPNEGIEYYYTFFPSLYSRLMQETRMNLKASLMKKRMYDFINDNMVKNKPFKVDWAIGSCLMIKREIFDIIGGFNEAFFLYEEETEWQYRMSQNGWLSYILPGATAVHNHHSSTSKIGKPFVYYHEFRSRIIFDHMRFKGFQYIIRILLIETGLGLRVIYFLMRSFFSKESEIKFKAYSDLLKLNSNPKQKILSDRFNFEKKKSIFV